LSDGEKVSGAATATLTLSNVDATDAGDYRCVVSSPYGSMTSNEAALAARSVGSAVGKTIQPGKVQPAGRDAKRRKGRS
jgi:hypothetical protein